MKELGIEDNKYIDSTTTLSNSYEFLFKLFKRQVFPGPTFEAKKRCGLSVLNNKEKLNNNHISISDDGDREAAAIAVEGKDFVEAPKLKLGVRANELKMFGEDGGCEMREPEFSCWYNFNYADSAQYE